jgi:FMN phosphatase YigB (HAD superfamily)
MRVQLLVSDLDNTLYDWISCFVPAFYDMVDIAAGIVQVSSERLLDELQIVHQRYGNTEHPFALLETKSVRDAFPNCTSAERRSSLEPAFRAFNHRRKRELHLYSNVENTLSLLRNRGVVIVGYTEATVNNVAHRLRVLGLWTCQRRCKNPHSAG